MGGGERALEVRANNSVDRVATNSVPIDRGSGFFGPSFTRGEILRIMKSDVVWTGTRTRKVNMSVEKSRFGFDEQASEAPPQTGESVSPTLARGFGAPKPRIARATARSRQT